MNIKILTWHNQGQSGAYQVECPYINGQIYSDKIYNKPNLSFEFISLYYIEIANEEPYKEVLQANEIVKVLLTEEEILEVQNWIINFKPTLDYTKARLGMELSYYLQNTDKWSIRENETGKAMSKDIAHKRAIARELVTELEDATTNEEVIDIIRNRWENEEWVNSFIPNVFSITQAQARLYMLQAGLLDQVEELLKDNLEAKIIWEYADEIKRDNKLISYVGEALNLSDEQLDEMFLEASKIEV